jgi:hypothetical protein
MSEADTTTTTTDPAGPDAFASLEAQAAGLEAASLPPDPNAPPPTDHRGEAREVAALALSILLPMLPDRYAARYGQREQQRIGDALGAWAEARGVSVGAMLGRWAPELALAAAVIGPALPVIVADAKARRQHAEQQHGPRPAQVQPAGAQP